ncbi:hypothetical protein AAL_05590 [Moelleriella libera RCEF 2490]|uniref:Uncharacterized protein n=1 Tax=Moelleriella libera RCEF 2490 TaxID=1081109 RepID=A0A168AFL9_9HYPO|nr:hypothetical protein AAL_05590 [Moelleriella libera RCEF 2490]
MSGQRVSPDSCPADREGGTLRDKAAFEGDGVAESSEKQWPGTKHETTDALM